MRGRPYFWPWCRHIKHVLPFLIPFIPFTTHNDHRTFSLFTTWLTSFLDAADNQRLDCCLRTRTFNLSFSLYY